MRNPILIVGLVALTAACSRAPQPEPAPSKPMPFTKESFGKTPDGTDVDIYTLRNGQSEVRITNYGARIVSLKVPDKNGQVGDVVLGFDTLTGYLATNPYFGAVVGRYGNRIAKGKFKLDGKEYKLATNNGPNALHGGIKGFDKVVWKEQGVTGADPAIRLTYVSEDGEEGYPGTLTTTVTYSLTSDNALRIDYQASTDKPTVTNITNHSYFNLKGDGDILGHEIQISASRFTPVDSGLIPTGQLRPVKGTPFDFTSLKAIGARINDNDQQLKIGGGYDHNFVFDSANGALAKAVEVYEPATGRVMEVLTTQPGVQFYTGNFLDGTITGKGGRVYARRSGFCLETQHFPDSPNKPKFPSTELRPGETFNSTTIYKFSTR